MTKNESATEKELHNDLVVSWNEVEEIVHNFEGMTDDELIKSRGAILERAKNTLHWLGKYVNEDDILHNL